MVNLGPLDTDRLYVIDPVGNAMPNNIGWMRRDIKKLRGRMRDKEPIVAWPFYGSKIPSNTGKWWYIKRMGKRTIWMGRVSAC